VRATRWQKASLDARWLWIRIWIFQETEITLFLNFLKDLLQVWVGYFYNTVHWWFLMNCIVILLIHRVFLDGVSIMISLVSDSSEVVELSSDVPFVENGFTLHLD